MSALSRLARSPLGAVLSASGMFLIAQLLAKVLNFVFFLLLARWLSVEHFGLLTYAVTLAVLADILADLGMTRVLLRDASRRPAVAARRLGRLIPLKAALGAVIYAILLGIVFLRAADGPLVGIFLVISVAMLTIGAALLTEQVLHARGIFAWSAVAHIALALTQLGLAALAHALGGGVVAIAAAMAAGNTVFLAVVMLGLLRTGVRLRLSARVRVWPLLLRRAAPFAVVSVLTLVILKTEFLVLGKLGNPIQLGYFGAASRIYEAALMVPLTLCAVLTPRLVHAEAHDRGALSDLYAMSLRLILSLCGALAVLGVPAAVPLVDLMLPSEYAVAAPVLKLLCLALVPVSVFLLNGALMLSLPRQHRPGLLLVGLVGMQVVIAATLIILVGTFGAALAALLSATVAAVITTVATRAWLVPSAPVLRSLLPPFVGLSAAGALMVVVGHEGLGQALGAFITYVVVTGLLYRALPVGPAAPGPATDEPPPSDVQGQGPASGNSVPTGWGISALSLSVRGLRARRETRNRRRPS